MRRRTHNTDFKLIAIQPHADCKESILKVLKKDEIYYFYSDYAIRGNKIIHTSSYPDGLYDPEDNNLNINISAIAGQNGSGKSSIVELLFMAINNVACYFKIKADLEPVIGLKVAIYFKYKSYFKLVVNEGEIECYGYSREGELISPFDKAFSLKDFFYTIGINYSHYAFNFKDFIDEEQKDWLSALFHKNDAYQTPLVINPWRDDGDININRENDLVKSRLISNLLRTESASGYDFRKITSNLRATRLVLTLNKKKILEGVLYNKDLISPDGKKSMEISLAFKDLKNIDKDKLLSKINKAYNFDYPKYKAKADEYEQLALDYLIRKLISISVRYKEYHEYYSKENDDFLWNKIDKYIKVIVGDRSHIGFKFKQTLNYLKHKHISLDPEDLKLSNLSATIKQTIESKGSYKLHVIELIPPPIFSVDIILEPTEGDKKDVAFKTLSSGEKQMIYSMSSILYHLFNLDSVKTSTVKKIKYRCMNIVLEEIELYFHPEMQRNYIKELRESIINLGLQDIRTLNICFITHSPFILSDIPDSNVMFLELIDGKAAQVNKFKKTFGANIHDLLADGFFMKKGVCGEFAIKSINEIIEFINNRDPERDKRKEDYLNLIKKIGEPIISNKLLEMYNEVFPEDRKKIIREEINRLSKLLKET